MKDTENCVFEKVCVVGPVDHSDQMSIQGPVLCLSSPPPIRVVFPSECL